VQKLQQKTAETDQVFRVDGEVFLMVLTDTNAQQALSIAQSLRVSINEALNPNTSIAITASIGLSMLPSDMDRKQSLKMPTYAYTKPNRHIVVTPMPTLAITNNSQAIRQAPL